MFVPALALLLASSQATEPSKPNGQGTTPPPTTNPATTAPKAAGTKTFSDKDLGIAFDYPAAWLYTKKDKKNPAKFVIPIDGTNAKGELKVIDLDYKGTPDLFQQTQATMVGTLNQTLVRQWQIEVLGVPMLLTKLKAPGEDGETTTLVGLLYANTPRKFNFRLTAPSGQFEAVELPWQDVLESLRTTTGALPASGDKPAIDPKDPKSATPLKPAKEVRTEVGLRKRPKPYRGEVPLELATGSQPAVLFLPKGWKAEPAQADGTLKLTNEKFGGTVVLRTYLAQADSPAAVLNRLAAERLTSFGKIERRYDAFDDNTPGDGAAASVYRYGTGTDGKSRLAYDGVYAQNVWFVSLSFESADASRFKGQAQTLTDLLKHLHIEAKS